MMTTSISRAPWNKGKLVGQKLPLKLEQIWAIRIRLEIAENVRELAMFNMANDCKLRSCDMVKLLVRDISRNGEVLDRAQVIQQKTNRPVRFEIIEKTRESVEAWIKNRGLSGMDYLWPSRIRRSEHITTHQYARIVKKWIGSIGLDPSVYATHNGVTSPFDPRSLGDVAAFSSSR